MKVLPNSADQYQGKKLVSQKFVIGMDPSSPEALNSFIAKDIIDYAIGCPSQTCLFKNQNSQPIPVVFGGWFEGSQKDF